MPNKNRQRHHLSVVIDSYVIYLRGYIFLKHWLFILGLNIRDFPLSLRSKGMSMATAINWMANFLITLTFLPLTDLIGVTGSFSLYGFLCFLSFMVCYFYVPETKNISLEAIEANLLAKRSLRNIGAA